MAEYIDREAFIKQEKDWYCKDCGKRKNSKGKIVYEIGGVPCRSCRIGDVLNLIEDWEIADVLPVVHGEWIFIKPPDDWIFSLYRCSVCGGLEDGEPKFCPNCGANMMGWE